MRATINGIEVEGSAAEIAELMRLQGERASSMDIEGLQRQLHERVKTQFGYCDGWCGLHGSVGLNSSALGSMYAYHRD